MAFTTRAAVHTQHGSPLTVTEITLPDPGPTIRVGDLS